MDGDLERGDEEALLARLALVAQAVLDQAVAAPVRRAALGDHHHVIHGEAEIIGQEAAKTGEADPRIRIDLQRAGHLLHDQWRAVAPALARLAVQGAHDVGFGVEVGRRRGQVEEDPQVDPLGADHSRQDQGEHLGEERARAVIQKLELHVRMTLALNI